MFPMTTTTDQPIKFVRSPEDEFEPEERVYEVWVGDRFVGLACRERVGGFNGNGSYSSALQWRANRRAFDTRKAAAAHLVRVHTNLKGNA